MQEQTRHLKIPRDIRNMLLADEDVVLTVKQSRWKALFTPDTIIVTGQRIIRYSPSGFFGIRKDIEDYRFEDVANFKINKGLAFATVTISHRFMSENLVLDGLPKRSSTDLSKAVQEGIRRVRGGSVAPATPPQSALDVLRMRFARGEITKEQFEDMKRTLE